MDIKRKPVQWLEGKRIAKVKEERGVIFFCHANGKPFASVNYADLFDANGNRFSEESL